MRTPETIDLHADETLALNALVWILGDPARADRLLALTGLTPDDLRAGAGGRVTLTAVLSFIAGHEPDLLACADTLDTRPEALVAAHRRLETP